MVGTAAAALWVLNDEPTSPRQWPPSSATQAAWSQMTCACLLKARLAIASRSTVSACEKTPGSRAGIRVRHRHRTFPPSALRAAGCGPVNRTENPLRRCRRADIPAVGLPRGGRRSEFFVARFLFADNGRPASMSGVLVTTGFAICARYTGCRRRIHRTATHLPVPAESDVSPAPDDVDRHSLRPGWLSSSLHKHSASYQPTCT